jgi:hypothetical protein
VTIHRTRSSLLTMLRQSVASGRSSHAALVSSQAAAVAAVRLNELKKEYEAVSALERMSAIFLRRIEGLGDDCDVMANAGEGNCRYLVHAETIPLSRASPWPGPRSMAEHVSNLEYVL